MQIKRQYIISSLLGLAVAALLVLEMPSKPKTQYFHNEGKVFGTYYNIRYSATEDLKDSIEATLKAFDNSLSLFNPHSVLSAVNANRDT